MCESMVLLFSYGGLCCFPLDISTRRYGFASGQRRDATTISAGLNGASGAASPSMSSVWHERRTRNAVQSATRGALWAARARPCTKLLESNANTSERDKRRREFSNRSDG